MHIEYIEQLVIDWGNQRGITNPETIKSQVEKLKEEVSELEAAVKSKNVYEVKDGIGDTMVVLTIICAQIGLDLASCYRHAYHEIKDRRGKTINGIFIKEGDL